MQGEIINTDCCYYRVLLLRCLKPGREDQRKQQMTDRCAIPCAEVHWAVQRGQPLLRGREATWGGVTAWAETGGQQMRHQSPHPLLMFCASGSRISQLTPA